jgi:hypothetical protein
MRPNERRNGQAIVMVTFALTLMLAVMSLAVDLGWGYYRREAGQSAADAAAAAAVRAVELATSGAPACGTGIVWCGTPAGTITNCPATRPTSATNSYDNACMLAAANGFLTTGSKTVSVQANATSPPPTVPGVTVSYWVTVRISETPASFFGVPIGIRGLSALSSNVIATSAITTSGSTTSAPCIYVLSPSGTTFTLGNGATVTTSSCGVYVNSTSTTGNKAVWVTSRLNSPSIKIVGGDLVNNGGCLATSSSAACGTLTPSTGAAAVADPFVNLPAPNIPGSCSSGNFTAWQATAYTTTGATAANPNAGCYNGFSLGNGMALNMGAGTYVINGGVFSIQGGTTLTGTSGVMVYLTNGAYVNIANGSTVNMAPESSGTYEGILFYQNRSMTSPTASTFAGGSNTNMTGSLYLPNSLVNINNGSSVNTEALVVGSVNFQGGATFNEATSQSQTGLAVSSSSVSVLQ